jgi:hypothetical protein
MTLEILIAALHKISDAANLTDTPKITIEFAGSVDLARFQAQLRYEWPKWATVPTTLAAFDWNGHRIELRINKDI